MSKGRLLVRKPTYSPFRCGIHAWRHLSAARYWVVENALRGCAIMFVTDCTVIGVASVILCCIWTLEIWWSPVAENEGNGNAHLPDPNKSALLTSSATIARKSCAYSVEVPWLENAETHEIIQFCHWEGWPGTSLKAIDVSFEFFSDYFILSRLRAHRNEEFPKNDLVPTNCNRMCSELDHHILQPFRMFLREWIPKSPLKLLPKWTEKKEKPTYQSLTILTWAVCAPKNWTFWSWWFNNGITSPQASGRFWISKRSCWRPFNRSVSIDIVGEYACRTNCAMHYAVSWCSRGLCHGRLTSAARWISYSVKVGRKSWDVIVGWVKQVAAT